MHGLWVTALEECLRNQYHPSFHWFILNICWCLIHFASVIKHLASTHTATDIQSQVWSGLQRFPHWSVTSYDWFNLFLAMCILSDINDPASNYFLSFNLSCAYIFPSQSFNTVRKIQWEKEWDEEKSWINLILCLVNIYNIKHRLSIWVRVSVGDLNCVTVIIIIR